jgi:hypothetical protein
VAIDYSDPFLAGAALRALREAGFAARCTLEQPLGMTGTPGPHALVHRVAVPAADEPAAVAVLGAQDLLQQGVRVDPR